MDFEATQPLRLRPVAVRFTGDGGEYFRIWIVNLETAELFDVDIGL